MKKSELKEYMKGRLDRFDRISISYMGSKLSGKVSILLVLKNKILGANPFKKTISTHKGKIDSPKITAIKEKYEKWISDFKNSK